MVRKPKRYARIPTKAEIERMLDVTMTSTKLYSDSNKGMFMRWRDRTALIVYFYTGLRPGELLNLRWEDIEFEKQEIRLLPYFNKQRIDLPGTLTRPAERALLFFRDKICPALKMSFEFVFPSMETFGPINTNCFGRIFRQLAEEAGILRIEWYSADGLPKYNYKTYTTRRWFATEVYDKTDDLISTSKLMRHLSPRSVVPYIVVGQERNKRVANKVFQ